MRRMAQSASIAVLAISAPPAVAQRADYQNAMRICDQVVALSDQKALDVAARNCFGGSVRTNANGSTVIIRFDPANMPMIGVGPRPKMNPGAVRH